MTLTPANLRSYPLHRADLKPAPFLPMSRAEMDKLGWDSFDIIISMNQQAEIENWGQLVAAVHKLQDS